MVKFLVGINEPIFDGRYGTDIGRNQFSGSELWHWPHTDPITFDFTKPETNPATPLLTDQPSLIDQFFQKVQGIDVVRIWLLERLEGITFDANSRIVGIDSHLLNNLAAILNSANAHGVRVYLCLLDSWVVKHEPPSGLPASRLGYYDIWNATIRNIMKDIVDNPFDFVNSVLQPLVAAIGNHPSVYAIDIMNEPEGMISDTPAVSISSMRNFVSQCCSKIRPQLQASVGCMRRSTAKSFSNLPIDFCDFHLYSEVARLDPYRPSDYWGKSCVIGECGYPVSSSNTSLRGSMEVRIAEDFVNEALRQGYSGCLAWTKDFTSDANKAPLLQWLKQFAGQNRQIMPPATVSRLAAFAAWLVGIFGRGR